MAKATTRLSDRTLYVRRNWVIEAAKDSARKRRWLENNRPRKRAKVQSAMMELRQQALNALGGKCAQCGYDADNRALQIDHVKGGGRQDRGTSPYGFLKRVIANLEAGIYQLLCANCNVIKRIENREFGRSPLKIGD